jgi:hypothetical protein
MAETRWAETGIVDLDRRKLDPDAELDEKLAFLNADAKRDPNLARDVLYLLYRASWRKRK